MGEADGHITLAQYRMSCKPGVCVVFVSGVSLEAAAVSGVRCLCDGRRAAVRLHARDTWPHPTRHR